MGKYSKVLANMPKKFGDEDSSAREQVDALKRQIVEDLNKQGGVTINALAEEVKQCRIKKDEMTVIWDDNNRHLSAYTELLLERFEQEGLTKTKVKSGGSIALDEKPYTSVIDKKANREWAEENGLGDQLTLHWSTLNSRVADCLENGLPLPRGIKVFNKQTIRYYKPRGGDE